MKMIKGMDISTLLEEEACGAKYYDFGEEADLLDILKRYGVNSVRLRLWNDPYDEQGNPYGAGTNDLDKTICMAKRAKASGMGFLLDYHYSDFWADPGKQIVPKAWQGYGPEQLEEAVYEYTVSTMTALREAGVAPTIVQVGNELTNGLLWPTGQKPNFDQLAKYINAGIRGVREVDDQVKIMIHLDNGGFNEMYVEWFDHFMERGEDFDVIGLSYYPFWHGTLDQLEYNMRDLAKRYQKELVENLEYPMTPKGQADFMEDIMHRIKSVPGGLGFYYWEPAWIPVPGCGWATEAALRYTGEEGPGGNEWANQALFDYDGNSLPALRRIRDFR